MAGVPAVTLATWRVVTCRPSNPSWTECVISGMTPGVSEEGYMGAAGDMTVRDEIAPERRPRNTEDTTR